MSKILKSKISIWAVVSLLLIVAMFVIKGDLTILDTRLFYLKSDLDLYFSLLSEEQKKVYFIVNVLDFIFMGAYTGLFIEVYKKSFPENDMYKNLLWIPLLLVLFDTLETSLIMYFISNYETAADLLKIILIISTPTKWFLALSSLLVIVNGFLLKQYLGKSN